MSYYQILGVSKDASKDDIRRAYKKLAMKEHPDKGGDVEKFKKIVEAYEVLSDDDKRRNFDSPQGNPTGFPGFAGFPEGFPGGFQGFQGMFSGGFQGAQLRDHVHVIQVSLEDIFKGSKVNLKVCIEGHCDKCPSKCPQCNGSGETRIPGLPMFGFPCPMCEGKCSVPKGCSECTKGKKQIEKNIEIEIVPGTQDGHQEVIKGFGEQKRNANETSGNLIIMIKTKPHPIFTRDGNVLVYKKTIHLTETIVGTKFDIPHFSGPVTFETHESFDPTLPAFVESNGLKVRIEFKVRYPTLKLTDVEKHIVLKILKA